MAVQKVSRGFLVEPSESGDGYVPFLVQVREEDIIWKSSNEFENYLAKYASGIDSVTPITPSSSYRIKRNDWLCDIQSDGLATMTKSIKIDDNFTLDEYNHIELVNNEIELPLLVVDDGYINIQVTKSSNVDELSIAEISTMITGSNIWNNIFVYTKMGIRLYSPIYRFPEDFKSLFDDCSIYINIRGHIPVV